ncbi:hypothetical protein CROQUDRAFT_650092 [Cronartium quercuum f. sp. fusiforme G11]|uniref:Uncharacterized protein n=1 Tax=Cronartium quercuum f. sp. fusiforme G11 TaxID=708437 RepID=A0A9P6TIR8_9BASI|nr:hypothetical protein CROQUDRAFT_650092 [Cronartium quercuum f. sp. fusiforme G11]
MARGSQESIPDSQLLTTRIRAERRVANKLPFQCTRHQNTRMVGDLSKRSVNLITKQNQGAILLFQELLIGISNIICSKYSPLVWSYLISIKCSNVIQNHDTTNQFMSN